MQHDKLFYMANQIATFFKSSHADIRSKGVADHINKFWEPRMRVQFFELIDAGGATLLPIVIEAAATVRRPGAPTNSEQANAGAPGGKGTAAGESKSEIAASQD